MRDALFQQFATVIHQQFGIQLPMDKKALLESRLFKLLNNNVGKPEYANEEAFLRYVQNDVTGKALAQLSEVITTHHTFFMREQDHFQFFGDTVLPELENHIKDGDVRTWCAACSSGEESYTLAMQLHDFFGIRGPGWEYTLLATDLSREILETAKQGIYSAESVATLPPRWQSTYFKKCDAFNFQVNDSLKQRVLYRPFNLMNPVFPFKRPFHVIFCRNVMIYFDTPTRNELVKKFYDFVEPGGYLFVGHSEVIDRTVAPFDYVMPSVYRRR